MRSDFPRRPKSHIALHTDLQSRAERRMCVCVFNIGRLHYINVSPLHIWPSTRFTRIFSSTGSSTITSLIVRSILLYMWVSVSFAGTHLHHRIHSHRAQNLSHLQQTHTDEHTRDESVLHKFKNIVEMPSPSRTHRTINAAISSLSCCCLASPPSFHSLCAAANTLTVH